MDSSSIELKGSEIEKIEVIGDTVKIYFSKAYIIKTMTGSIEKTRWYQSGFLVFENAEIQSKPETPLVCTGGDVSENVYTYRDMIPVPLQSQGRAGCNIAFEATEEHLIIDASAVRLQMLEVPKYIEHIRPE